MAETFSPGANVSAIARTHGLDPSQVYVWRPRRWCRGWLSRWLQRSASR
ncbi:transposase [Mesorhizobium sp. M0571]